MLIFEVKLLWNDILSSFLPIKYLTIKDFMEYFLHLAEESSLMEFV